MPHKPQAEPERKKASPGQQRPGPQGQVSELTPVERGARCLWVLRQSVSEPCDKIVETDLMFDDRHDDAFDFGILGRAVESQFVAAFCKQQIQQDQCGPFVSVEETVIRGEGLNERGGFSRHCAVIAGVRARQRGLDEAVVMDAGAAAIFERFFMRGKRVAESEAIVPLIFRQGALMPVQTLS